MKLLILFVFLFPVLALAEDSFEIKDQRSGNYKKAERLLPGELVVTPTGQRMKVWSTEGPVPVSQAPEPFQKPNAGLPDSVGVVVDHDARRRELRRRGEGSEEIEQ